MKKIQLKFKLQKILHNAQLQIYAALKDYRFIILLAGRRFGKSRIFCFVAFITALKKSNANIWFVYPSYKVGLPAWRTMKRLVKGVFKNSDAIIIRETARVIEFPNGSYIEFKSADDASSLRGEGLDLVILDEMNDMKLEEVWTSALLPSLMTTGGKALMGGTPKDNPKFAELYYEAEKGKEGWKAFHFTTYDNPMIPREEIELLKANQSEKQFAQEALAQFIKAEGNTFKASWFQTRMDIGSVKPIATFISWDTASVVSNSSAYSAGVVGQLLPDYRCLITKVYRKRLEFPELEYAVKKLADEYMSQNLVGIIIEYKSSGIAVAQSLKQTSEYADLIYTYNPKGNKEDRANIASKWVEKQCVLLPYHSAETDEWLVPFEQEIFDFPNGIYRDQADSFSQLLDYMSNYFQQRLDILNSQKARR